MLHMSLYILNVWDPKTHFDGFMKWFCVFLETVLMMIPSESKHVAQGQ